ncbi:Beta-amyrin 28-oxidase [Quillaja saponaria]|uniref:Beta-amyrin 28-oxidase n=1 Tax=Quillaja saponaria TaxID=32244 RepID=A0AAD7PII4_QUISA|nr:Beta-amyrin 28-oxidase [Quillaja saponaria]
MFHHMAKKYTLELGCTMFLNVEDPQELAKFQRIILKISSGMYAVPLNVLGTRYWRAIRESKKLQKEIEKIIKQRNIEILAESLPTEQDLISHLIQETHRDGETLNEADVAHKVFGLLMGAYDNVSMTLVSIVKYLAELPEVYDNVFKEQMEIARSKASGELLTWGDLQKMKYSWNVVCEALRLWPPIVGTFRVAKTDFIYEGF